MRRRLFRNRGTATGVAVVVLALYGAWIGAYLITGGDVRDFIRIGTRFLAQGDHRSKEIRLDPGYHPPANQNRHARGYGYDGQLTYYIALDPSKARYYMDLPSYRYTHILQPLVVRGLAMGNREAIPWLLVVVNWLAVGAGTWAVAAWLRRRGLSPWWAAIYGLWPGMFIAVQRDLTEPLSYALVPMAILVLEGRGRWRLPAAGVIFGLAGLARQTTLVFPLVYALWIAFNGDVEGPNGAGRGPSRRRAAALLALSAGPYVAYTLFLLGWLGSIGTGGSSAIPFAGLVHPPFRPSRQGIDLVFVVLPAIVALAAFLPRRPFSRPSWLPWFLLLANFLANVIFYGNFYRSTYTSVSRVATGIVLSALLCLPNLREVDERRRTWLAAATIVSMSLTPIVAVYGFTNVGAPG
jgi:tryptophan-rich sensory protein